MEIVTPVSWLQTLSHQVSHHRSLFIFTFLFFYLNTTKVEAQSLAQELDFKASDAAYWQSRSRNFMEMERYMYRNWFMPPAEDFRNSAEFLKTNPYLNLINQAVNNPIVRNAQHHPYFDLIRDRAQRLDQILEPLPALETEVYQGNILTPEFLNQLNVGSIYHEEAFMSGSASLHEAYQFLQEYPPTPYPKAILKIAGKRAKMASFLYQTERGNMVWNSKSFFKVIGRDYDTLKKIHFISLEEVLEKDIKNPERMITSSHRPYQPPSCTR